jgi:hypothetical protein
MAATYLSSNDGLVVDIAAVAAAADAVVGVDGYDDVVAVAVAAADVVAVADAVAVVRRVIVWMYYFYPDKCHSEIDWHRIS